MKKSSPLLPLIVLCLFSCGAQSFTPQAETLPAVQGPARVMDSTLRLNLSHQLEVFQAGEWRQLAAKGLPTRVLYPDKDAQPRPISAFAQGVGDNLALVTPLELYQSSNGGADWTPVTTRDTFGNYAYFTTVGLSPLDPKIITIGTSFHGLHESRDGGKTWTNISKPFDGLAAGAGYYEVINALAYSQTEPDTLYVSVGINGALFKVNSKTLTASKLTFPGEKPLTLVDRLITYKEGTQEILEARTREAYWRYETAAKAWLNLGARQDREVLDDAKQARLERSKDKNGLYLSSFTASNPKLLQAHLDFMAEKELNAVVIDLKEDTGLLAYQSNTEMAKKLGNSRARLDVPALVKTVHDRGYYLIARVVVFKDEQLYRYAGNKYALWDKTTNKPWGFFKEVVNETTQEKTYVQKEFWVDTWAKDVWDYNIAIARELEGLGIDEIQFDYIRFPSDGPVKNITSRYKVDGMSKMDALESFLKEARSQIAIPISADIFGFNGYFTMDYLGQNMDLLSNYVDAISPMFYPSHFARTFLPKVPYLDRAYQIYSDGSNRTWMATNGRINVRPWVQAFLIGGETKFDTPTFTAYLAKQLQGVQASKSSGMLLWNASNKYYMVTKTVSQFKQPGATPVPATVNPTTTSTVPEAATASSVQVPPAR